MAPSFGRLVLAPEGGGRQEFTLLKRAVSLGRNSTNDIVLNDTKASRSHARIECTDTGCVLVDLGSANGTRVNGNKIERATLAPGDVINLGDSVFHFELSGSELDPEITRVVPDEDEDLDATLAGTALTMEVQETAAPRLVVYTPSRTWEVPLSADALTIGRHPDNDVVLETPRASRRHARIVRNRDSFEIVDLHSDNGTWLGQQRIDRHTLADGETIRIGNARLVFKAGFQADDLTVLELTQAGAHAKRRPVVFVPGFGGSNLYRGSEQIWPNPRRWIHEPELLHSDVDLEVRGLLREIVIIPNVVALAQYGLLIDYLSESLGYESGNDLLEFGWDFRKDVRESARRLGAAIEAWSPKSPITIIAHSMGCLVTRYYVERLGGKKQVERIILLAVPQSGTPSVFTTLFRGPNVLPFGMRNDRLRDVISTFPPLYQALPTYPFAFDGEKPIDVLRENSWLPADRRKMLQFATDFRGELGTHSSVPTVCVFGYGLKTVTRVNLQRDESGQYRKLGLDASLAGDDNVPESSAVIDGAEIHPVRQHHGALYVDNDVKMRLKMELTRPAHRRTP